MLPAAPPGQTWVGDDAAVLEDGLLVATDALVEGVHFALAWSSPADAGWKAVAVNVSDVAAMGGAPRAGVLALVVPGDRPGLADAVATGAVEAGTALGCPLVGGDTTGGPLIVAAVTVVGDARGAGPVLRSGARPGDAVFVTGSLGGARLALRTLEEGGAADAGALARLRRPWPRVPEGQAAASAGATAMIDVSDGLARDLGHVCEASGVGVRLEASALPLAPGASLDDALASGDEYELCFTAPDPDLVEERFVSAGLVPPARVGTVTAEPRRVLVTAGGESALPDLGWEHRVP